MKRKIMYIHHSGLIGGAGVSFQNTCKALQEIYDVSAYVPRNPPNFLNSLNQDGFYPNTYDFKIGAIPNYSGGPSIFNPKFWARSGLIFTQIYYWRKIIRKENPDLVIVNSKILCWMGILLRKENIKSMCFVRETMPGSSNRIINKLVSKILETFTSVVFISQYDLNIENLVNTQSIVSPDFIDEKKYIIKDRKESSQNLNISSESFNVLYVGGVNEMKGFEVAVKAINELKEKQISLVVAGSPYLEINKEGLEGLAQKIIKRKSIKFSNRMKKYIESNNLKEKITFVGYQTDMSDCFSSCDILIFPMIHPHQARPAFEIGLYKKTVIISDYDQIKEFIQNNYNGITFEPNSYKDLANVINTMYSDNNIIKKLGENNYNETIKYHTKDYSIKMLLNEIDSIM